MDSNCFVLGIGLLGIIMVCDLLIKSLVFKIKTRHVRTVGIPALLQRKVVYSNIIKEPVVESIPQVLDKRVMHLQRSQKSNLLKFTKV